MGHISSLLPRFFLFLTLAGMAFMTMSNPGLADEKPQRLITITGQGHINVAPDRAQINIGVVSEGLTAKEALDLNSEKMSRVVNTIKELGVKDKHIQTTNFSVQPQYQHFKNGQPPKIKGYTVRNTVEILLKDIAALGGLLDKVVASGSNQIHGIQFLVSKQDELKDEARKLAVKAAKRKAALLAKAAGVELGEIVSISEGRSQHQRPAPFARTIATEAASAPIQGGEQQLSASVTITWLLK